MKRPKPGQVLYEDGEVRVVVLEDHPLRSPNGILMAFFCDGNRQDHKMSADVWREPATRLRVLFYALADFVERIKE